MKIIKTILFIVVFAICSNAQKINIIVADNCGFVVKGKTVGVNAVALPTAMTTIASVQFTVDGNVIGAGPITTPPYTFNWDSTTVMDGCHTIAATATDSNGNSGLASVTVSVKN